MVNGTFPRLGQRENTICQRDRRLTYFATRELHLALRG